MAIDVFMVEAARPGFSHASFNAAMLESVVSSMKEPDCRVTMFCDRGHYEAVTSILPLGAKVQWQEISVVDGFTRNFVRKFSRELLVALNLVARARKRHARIVFLSMYPNVLAAFLLVRPFFRNVDVHVVLHGELESLLIPEKRGIHREGFWTAMALLKVFGGRWPKLYVLGEGIRTRLMQSFPEKPHLAELVAIHHPYIFDDDDHQLAEPSLSGKIRVGFVGTGRLVKGIDRFFVLAESMSEYVRAGSLEFVVVGGLEDRAKSCRNEYAQVLADQLGGLSSSNYLEAIGGLHCAVFLSPYNYRFTASGSVFDVINRNVEVLSLENHYFQDLARLDDENGIKFFDDVDEIRREIVDRLERKTRFQRFAFDKIKQHYGAKQPNVLTSAVCKAT